MFDSSPSPERDPHQSGATPKKPHLEIRTLDPIAFEINLEHSDRLTDVLHLCGLTPSDDSIEYVWKALLKGHIPDLNTFTQHQGALGLNMELDSSAKHELEWRGDILPERCEFDEHISFTLSTRHREGSDLSLLQNLSEGSPALDGLFLELIATPLLDAPAMARIFWDEATLGRGTAGERWQLIRGFLQHFKEVELPASLPLAPGQREKFHYLTLELDPMQIKVQRLASEKPDGTPQKKQPQLSKPATRPLELTLRNPPHYLLEEIVKTSGALQLDGPWANETSHQQILTHLLDRVTTLRKLDIDELKMCASARPCLLFSREESCDGACYPPRFSSKVTMTDYTCRGGELYMEIRAEQDGSDIDVRLAWDNTNPRYIETDWAKIKELARPYLIDPRNG